MPAMLPQVDLATAAALYAGAVLLTGLIARELTKRGF